MARRTPTRGYAGRSAQERRAERRERLLDAGLELFGTEGYAATSIERLCTTAGVSTRNFYQEFTGREALLIALHERITQQAFTAAAEALAAAEDEVFAQRVSRVMRAYIGTTSTDPRRTRVAYVELIGVSAAVEHHRLAWRARIAAWVEAEGKRAVQRGEVPDRDFHHISVALIGAVNELVYDWETHERPVPLERLCAELTHLIVAAVTTPWELEEQPGTQP